MLKGWDWDARGMLGKRSQEAAISIGKKRSCKRRRGRDRHLHHHIDPTFRRPNAYQAVKKSDPRREKWGRQVAPEVDPADLEKVRVGLESGSGKWTPFFPPLRALELLGHSPRGLARGGFVGVQRPDEQRLACPRGFKVPSWRPSELKRARGGLPKLI